MLIIQAMRKSFFRILARMNKFIFPSFSKKGLNISSAKKWQLLILGWRYFVTKNSL